MNIFRTLRQPLLALALVAVMPAIAGESQYTESLESVLTMRIDGEIEVGADGHVKSHKLDAALPPEIRTPVEKAIGAWRFAPPMVDGKPVEKAIATMRIALVATQRDDKNYVLKIENVTFNQAATEARPATSQDIMIAAKRPMPRFRATANVLVSMLFHIDANGGVLDVAPTQCTVLAVAPKQDPAMACKALERESVTALRNWKITMPPGGDGQPTDAMLALFFTRDGASSAPEPGKWRRELRSAYRRAPWQKADAPRLGTAEADAGLVRPYAGLKLEEGIGKTL